jgi:hypothetical protein
MYIPEDNQQIQITSLVSHKAQYNIIQYKIEYI